MPITYLRSKLLLLMLGLVASINALADSALLFTGGADKPVAIEMADGATYELKQAPDVSGIRYDKYKHKVNDDFFISVFEVSASNPGRPAGYCGAGNEMWLYVYRVEGTALIEKKRVLVSSCLRSVSMASQNTGDAMQDFDFSSVQWNAQGFSIDWFSNVDAAGKPLKTTHYLLRDEGFAAQEILEEPSVE